VRPLAVLVLAAGLVAALAAPAAAAPPGAGVLVPGRSLGGVALGDSKAAVEARWGRAYGICRGCAAETWYFNYYAFQPKGTAVEWRDGRVAAVFTLWQPLGWRTTRGLELDDHVSRVTGVYGPLPRTECPGYAVYALRRRTAVTTFVVLGDRLWAFGLARPGLPLCRA
jgi:hypothetical protein